MSKAIWAAGYLRGMAQSYRRGRTVSLAMVTSAVHVAIDCAVTPSDIAAILLASGLAYDAERGTVSDKGEPRLR